MNDMGMRTQCGFASCKSCMRVCHSVRACIDVLCSVLPGRLATSDTAKESRGHHTALVPALHCAE